jgi:hypothetical protein
MESSRGEENERPRGEPRSITERNTQELRSKPRFLHYFSNEESGASCGVFIIPPAAFRPRAGESGIKNAPGNSPGAPAFLERKKTYGCSGI